MKTTVRFFTFLFIGLMMVPAAQAFNKDRCSKLFPTFDDDHPPYASPIYVSTMVPSTTSYFSSIGPCAMYGKSISVARRFYIEDSMSEIQIDVARGQGEHVYALAEYSGCPVTARQEFATEMRANYRSLFSSPKDSHQLAVQIDKVISAGPLRKKCTMLN